MNSVMMLILAGMLGGIVSSCLTIAFMLSMVVGHDIRTARKFVQQKVSEQPAPPARTQITDELELPISQIRRHHTLKRLELRAMGDGTGPLPAVKFKR